MAHFASGLNLLPTLVFFVLSFPPPHPIRHGCDGWLPLGIPRPLPIREQLDYDD
jgi:hypothetical protein